MTDKGLGRVFGGEEMNDDYLFWWKWWAVAAPLALFFGWMVGGTIVKAEDDKTRAAVERILQDRVDLMEACGRVRGRGKK